MKISSISKRAKPTSLETIKITSDLKKVKNTDYTDEVLVKLIEQGHTLILENIKEECANGKDGVINTKYIGLDFDEEHTTIEYTLEKLKTTGLSYYILYKTFSYTEEKQKHRYIIKLDRPITPEEYTLVLNYLKFELKGDADPSTFNMGRIWYTTKHTINEEHKTFNIQNANELIGQAHNYIKTVKIKPSKHHTNILDVNIPQKINVENKEVYRLLNERLKNYTPGKYNELRIYSLAYLCGYLEEMLGHELKDVVIKMLLSYNSDADVTRFIHEMSIWREHTTDFIEKLSQLNKNNDIFYTFPIFEGIRPLIGNYISIEDLKGIDFYKHNLINAPAGVGKTKLIIGLIELGYRVMLLVPTQALVRDLYNKYGQLGGVSVFCQDINQESHNTNLIISTYDQYHKLDIAVEYIKFIDEGHEVAGFYFMNGANEGRKKLVEDFYSFNVLTASPCNLPDTFDHKFIFSSHKPKSVTIITTNITDYLHENLPLVEGRTMVFMDDIKKMNKLMEMLKAEHPYLNIGIIKGSDTEKISALLKCEDVPDILLCTKVLNIGVDLQGIFTNLIYAGHQRDMNNIIQFANRDRQAKNYTILLQGNASQWYGKHNYNERFISVEHLPESEIDAEFLDNTYIDGEIKPLLYTEKLMQRKKIGIDELIKYLHLLNPKWDIVREVKECKEQERETTKKTYKAFMEYVDTKDYETNYGIYNNKLRDPNSKARYTEKFNLLPRMVRHKLLYVWSVMDKTFKENPKELYYYTGIEYFDNIDTKEVREQLKDVVNRDFIPIEEANTICILFNSLKWKINPKNGWLNETFIKDMSKLNIYLVKVKNNNKVIGYKNITVTSKEKLKKEINEKTILDIKEGLYNTGELKKLISKLNKNHNYKGDVIDSKNLPFVLEEYGFILTDRKQKRIENKRTWVQEIKALNW